MLVAKVITPNTMMPTPVFVWPAKSNLDGDQIRGIVFRSAVFPPLKGDLEVVILGFPLYSLEK